ncbi:HD-domain/PDEase-like protein, partial [Backusella circina FSU 941]
HKLLANIEEASNGCSIKTTESEFRTNVIKMILATDMIFHFELQESLNNLVELSDDLSMNNALASVKDIFTSQGEKSAISYFRQKSYFDAEVPCHFESILPVSPGKEKINEETEEEEGGGEFLIADNQNVMFHEPEEIKPFEREKNKCMMDSQYRLLLCEIIVHAADISNPVRPWPICHAWADLVAEEFFGQGDAEKELGLSVSPNMDRNKISKGIIGMQFSEFIIRPFFETFSEMFPKASVLLTNVQDNYDHWVELEKSEKMNQQDEEGGGHCYPTSMLPNRPMLNPPGRRVSVAAGMIIIPDQKPSNYLIPRSASHIDLAEFDQFKRKQKELHCRRKSEQPRMSLPEVSSRRTPIGQKY